MRDLTNEERDAARDRAEDVYRERLLEEVSGEFWHSGMGRPIGGAWYYRPLCQTSRAFNAWELRAIADELDRRNPS